MAINIDTKYIRDLPQVMETVLRLNIADQVVVKTDIDLDADHFTVLDADWFGKIPHMPMFPVRLAALRTTSDALKPSRLL